MPLLGPISAFLSSCTWALGTTAYARVGASVPAPAVNATRALIGGPILALALALRAGPAGAVASLVDVPATSFAVLVVSTLASYGIGDALFLTSTQRLGVPAALAIGSTYPLWAVLAGTLFLGEPAGATRILGVVTVVIGTVMVILTGARAVGKATSGAERVGRPFTHAVVPAIGTSWFWAINGIGVRHAGAALPPLVVGTIRLGTALVLCVALGWVFRPRAPNRVVPWTPFVPWAGLRPVLWVFALESAGGTLLFVHGVSRSPIALGVTLTSLAPVLSLPLAWASGHERPSLAKGLGVAIVTAGVILLLV